MAQQAVSGSVRRLERELGVDLLSRTTRQVTTTPAGDALLARRRRRVRGGRRGRARSERHRDAGGLARRRPRRRPPGGRRAAGGGRRRGRVGTRGSPRRGRPPADDAGGRRRAGAHAARRRRHRERGPHADAGRPRGPRVPPAGGRWPRAAGRHRAGAPAGAQRARDAVHRPARRPARGGGAHPEVVESRITGASDLSEVAEEGCVSLLAEGAPAAPGVAFVALAEPITLPLLVAWAAGTRPAAVARLRDAMAAER